jgi:HAD superfamily hydrolase (TIGR01549 family)
VKLLLFDFDGTIADTLDISIECANIVSKKHGYKLMNRKIIMEKGIGYMVKQWNIPPWKLLIFMKELKALTDQRKSEIKAFKGISLVIKKLKAKTKIGIITTNSEKIVNEVLKKNNISVDFIIANSSLFGKHALIKKALRHYEAEKNNTIYIGDEIRDIEASKKAGIRIACVSWGYNSETMLKKLKPDYLLRKPSELLKIIS